MARQNQMSHNEHREHQRHAYGNHGHLLGLEQLEEVGGLVGRGGNRSRCLDRVESIADEEAIHREHCQSKPTEMERIPSAEKMAGKIKRLNFARHGEVNGAVLQSGDFVPLGPSPQRN